MLSPWLPVTPAGVGFCRPRFVLTFVVARDFVGGQSKLNIHRLPASVLRPSWWQRCESYQTADFDVDDLRGRKNEPIRLMSRYHDHTRSGRDGESTLPIIRLLLGEAVIATCVGFPFIDPRLGMKCKNKKADEKGLLLSVGIAYVYVSALLSQGRETFINPVLTLNHTRTDSETAGYF